MNPYSDLPHVLVGPRVAVGSESRRFGLALHAARPLAAPVHVAVHVRDGCAVCAMLDAVWADVAARSRRAAA